MAPRPHELRPYRIAVYAAFGVVCALVFTALIRSVVVDLYGRAGVTLAPAAPPTPTACLEDVERLYASLAARAVQPAPGGLARGSLSAEFDTWSRRWEAEVDSVSTRCGLGTSHEPALQDVAQAMEALEELRRVLSHSSEDVTREASQVRDALAAARQKLQLR